LSNLDRVTGLGDPASLATRIDSLRRLVRSMSSTPEDDYAN
jgi:hypothetical protein